MAKQEKRGKKQSVDTEPSVSSIDEKRKDFGFEVEGSTLFFKDMVSTYSDLMKSIIESTILKSKG